MISDNNALGKVWLAYEMELRKGKRMEEMST